MLPEWHVQARSSKLANDWADTCGVTASPSHALLQLLQEQLIVLVRCLQGCTTAEGLSRTLHVLVNMCCRPDRAADIPHT